MKDRLKLLRKTLGLKQREVAERLGVNVGLIGQWESGTKAVGKARIYQLCKEYDVRREWLERGEGDMFEPNDSKEKAQEEFIAGVFDKLDAYQKERILSALRTKIREQNGERTQTNNGTVGGDMIQY